MIWKYTNKQPRQIANSKPLHHEQAKDYIKSSNIYVTSKKERLSIKYAINTILSLKEKKTLHFCDYCPCPIDQH